MLTVAPPDVTGTPSAEGSGPANFSGAVDLFSNPVGSATIALDMQSNLGWQVTPPSQSFRVTEPGHYPFNFTVEVPPDSVAGQTDQISVTVNYRIGAAVAYTETATVHAVAGAFYAGSVRRVGPAQVMEPGRTYAVPFDLRNDGNARASFTFVLPDSPAFDRLRAAIDVPDGPTVAGQNNTTVEFLVTPGATSPAGRHQVPLQMEARDRTGQLLAVVNFTLDVEVNNLAIYQGVLPNWDLRAPYALGVYAMLVAALWFGVVVLLAWRRARNGGAPFVAELKEGLARSRLVRALRGAARRAAGARPRRGASRGAPLRPSEVKGRASVRAERGR
jgi:hypothetical protein